MTLLVAQKNSPETEHAGGDAHIGTAHVTSGADDNTTRKQTTPPNSTQEDCSDISRSSLSPGDNSKVRNLCL